MKGVFPMKRPILYRKRLIPEECILLKDDELLYRDEKKIITRWNTLRPKKDLHHGFSCYFLDKGIKVSKFYKADGSLICWYCDIVTHSYDKATDTYVFTDLLADVLVYPDGRDGGRDNPDGISSVGNGTVYNRMCTRWRHEKRKP